MVGPESHLLPCNPQHPHPTHSVGAEVTGLGLPPEHLQSTVTSLGRTIGGSCLFMCMAGIWGCLPMSDLISRASTYTFSWHDPTLSNTPCRWTDSPSDRWPGPFLLEREVPPGPTSSLACTSSSESIPGNLFKACWNSCRKGQIWPKRAFFPWQREPRIVSWYCTWTMQLDTCHSGGLPPWHPGRSRRSGLSCPCVLCPGHGTTFSFLPGILKNKVHLQDGPQGDGRVS